MIWKRITTNADSPYPEDRRTKYTCGHYEITKEGDGKFWLRFGGRALGMGPRLSAAKEAAEQHATKGAP